MTILLIIIIGLAIGSFINALVYRLNKKLDIIWARSQCPKCKKNLKVSELIPVFSFLIQRGKCRNCKKNISWQYPAVEIITALIFVLIFLIINPQYYDQWVYYLGTTLFSIILITIFIYDFKYYLIPDILVIPGVILAILFSLLSYRLTIWQALLGSIIAGVFFLFLVLISREQWMGWGDVKLSFFIGALLGWPIVIIGLFISFISGAFIGLIMVGMKKKKLKSAVPFGTFLTASTLIAILWGEKLLNWYLGIIGF